VRTFSLDLEGEVWNYLPWYRKTKKVDTVYGKEKGCTMVHRVATNRSQSTLVYCIAWILWRLLLRSL